MTNRVESRSLIGQRVKVHFNLHTHLWSITAIAGEHAGRVVASVNAPVLTDQLTKVTYNPSQDRAGTFTAPDGSPVLHAPRASFARCPSRPDRGYGWI